MARSRLWIIITPASAITIVCNPEVDVVLAGAVVAALDRVVEEPVGGVAVSLDRKSVV